jgi:hypothetical protein
MEIQVSACDRCRAFGPDAHIERRGILRDDKTVWLDLCAHCRKPLDDLWDRAPIDRVQSRPRRQRRRGIQLTPIEDLPIPEYELDPPPAS